MHNSPPKYIAIPCVLVRCVNPADNVHIEAAKSDWDLGLFKSI